MKIIIVKSCLDCPHIDIRNPEDGGGELWCGDRHLIGKMEDIAWVDDYIDPRCELTDVGDYGVDVENVFRYCG